MAGGEEHVFDVVVVAAVMDTLQAFLRFKWGSGVPNMHSRT